MRLEWGTLDHDVPAMTRAPLMIRGSSVTRPSKMKCEKGDQHERPVCQFGVPIRIVHHNPHGLLMSDLLGNICAKQDAIKLLRLSSIFQQPEHVLGCLDNSHASTVVKCAESVGAHLLTG
jgi:hypothetical protein